MSKIKIEENEVSQEFDLNDLLGVDVSEDAALGEAVGQYIIDKIVDRTKSGKSVGGQSFRSYSEAYKESLAFAAWDKTDEVNLTLSGDMLNALDILQNESGKIKIGFNDLTQTAKAFGHITGMRGHPTLEGKMPKRNFFGLNAKEIAELKKEFRRLPAQNEQEAQNDSAIFNRLMNLVGL